MYQVMHEFVKLCTSLSVLACYYTFITCLSSYVLVLASYCWYTARQHMVVIL